MGEKKQEAEEEKKEEEEEEKEEEEKEEEEKEEKKEEEKEEEEKEEEEEKKEEAEKEEEEKEEKEEEEKKEEAKEEEAALQKQALAASVEDAKRQEAMKEEVKELKEEASEKEHEGKTEEAGALEQKAEALKAQLREEKVIELGEEEVEQEGDGLDECLLGCPNANKETFKTMKCAGRKAFAKNIVDSGNPCYASCPKSTRDGLELMASAKFNCEAVGQAAKSVQSSKSLRSAPVSLKDSGAVPPKLKLGALAAPKKSAKSHETKFGGALLALVLVSTFLVIAALVLYFPKHGVLAKRAASSAGSADVETPEPDSGSDSGPGAGAVDALTGQP